MRSSLVFLVVLLFLAGCTAETAVTPRTDVADADVRAAVDELVALLDDFHVRAAAAGLGGDALHEAVEGGRRDAFLESLGFDAAARDARDARIAVLLDTIVGDVPADPTRTAAPSRALAALADRLDRSPQLGRYLALCEIEGLQNDLQSCRMFWIDGQYVVEACVHHALCQNCFGVGCP